jgi:hypothetical protein
MIDTMMVTLALVNDIRIDGLMKWMIVDVVD